MLGYECPAAVLPDRALCLPTLSHFLIVIEPPTPYPLPPPPPNSAQFLLTLPLVLAFVVIDQIPAARFSFLGLTL